MTKRLEKICMHLRAVPVLADVGCDHGYCAKYALENGLCERVYITDVSRESLRKAEALLAEEIAAGRCKSVCCDGLDGVPEQCDSVLIAGMGGEEIIHILRTLPAHFVLQPMKNAEKVRRYLVERGAKILTDITFFAGKYYHLIAGEGRGGDTYSPLEFAFGRDNLKNPTADFAGYLQAEIQKLNSYSREKMNAEARAEHERRLAQYLEVLHGAQKNL